LQIEIFEPVRAVVTEVWTTNFEMSIEGLAGRPNGSKGSTQLCL